MKRLALILCWLVLAVCAPASAQMGSFFPGPGTAHSAGGGGSCPAYVSGKSNTGTNATGTTITYTTGAALSAGDLVLGFATEGDPSSSFAGPGTLTPSVGTTLLDNYDGSATLGYVNVWRYTATGGETSFTSATASRNVQGTWALVVYSGANASPVDGNSLAFVGTTSTTMTAASISPVGSTDTLVAFASATGGGSSGSTNFSGMTSRVALASNASFTNQTNIYVADSCLSASGATGTRTATQSTNQAYFSGLVGIKP